MASLIAAPQPHIAKVNRCRAHVSTKTVRPVAAFTAARCRPALRYQPVRAKVEDEDDVVTTAVVDLADETVDDAINSPSDVAAWAEQELRALDYVDHALPPVFSLSFLWLDKNIAVAADQVFNSNQRSPLTEYFFWPKKDAWDELKTALESRPWISERDKVLLLNKATEVINFWQDESNKHTIDQARQKFPNCLFLGS